MSRVQPKMDQIDMPRTRKRRTASLIAEALWNIQMEDDITGGSRKSSETNKITLRQSAKSVGESTHETENPQTTFRKMSHKKFVADFPREKKSKTNDPGNPGKAKLQPCVYHSTANSYRNLPKVYRSKGKLTASVPPLVKSEAKPTRFLPDAKQADSEQRTNSVSINSQLLLLPISLNHSSITGGHSVPVLTLHASPVNVDLMQCLDSSRILNVTPLLTGSSGTHGQLISNEPAVRNPRYNSPRISDNQILVKDSDMSTLYSDQTEPLNLKLGESSIPSSSLNKSEKVFPFGRFYTVKHNSKNRTFSHTNKRPAYLATSHKLAEFRHDSKTGCLPTKLVKTSKARKCGSTIIHNELIGYDAESPSSESSSSTDFDDSSLELKKSKRSQKTQINLRCKAAPPPSNVHQNIGSSLTNHFPNKIRSKRITSIETDYVNNNGWEWGGKPYEAYVYSVDTGKPVLRQCYPAMRRSTESSEDSFDDEFDEDDVVMVRDCVMMRADGDEQGYVAKVAALWQHESGKMMISLLWFYRPEHTEDSRVHEQLDRYSDRELFASRHLDEISVACVEDKCYVLTYHQFCRFQASEKKNSHLGIQDGRTLIPFLHSLDPDFFPSRPHQKIATNVDQSLVFFCRKLYDIKLHRLLKTFSPPTSLFSVYAKSAPASSSSSIS